MTTELYIEIRQYLRELIRNTEWEGHLYAVGGCCRDELMGQPIKDVRESMRRNAHRLEIITTERIHTELDKMLTCKHPVMALELLRDTGALQFVIPELAETFDMRQNRYHFGTVWQHTLKVVEGVPNQLVLRLAALLHDVGKINTRSVGEDGSVHFIGHEIASVDLAVDILRRLKYSNAVIHEVAFLIRHHMDLKPYGDDAKKLKDKKLRKIQYICGTKERFENMLALIDADNKAHADGYCMPNQVEIVSRRTAAMEDDGSAMFGYRMPLSGNDIMRIKGLKPGREVKDCTAYLMKLAFVNPLRPVEEFEKHLKGYHLK